MEAKEFKGLMEAYASVYEQTEVLSEETLEEKKIATGTGKKVMPSAEERSKLAKKARAGEDIGKKGKGFEEVAAKAAKQYGSKEAGERVAAAAMFKQQAKEEVQPDVFDTILEHLVAEGYADTNQAALAIMANMSESWKQSIVEAVYGGGQSPTDTPADTNKKMVVTNADKLGNTPAYQRLKAGDDRYVAAPHLKGV